MLQLQDIDLYINNKITFYKELKKHYKEDLEIMDSIVIDSNFIKTLESEFKDFLKLREENNKIPQKENENFKRLLISKFEILRKIKENNNRPSIYWFEILDNTLIQNEKLWEKFKSSKKAGTGQWSKANKNPSLETNILYLGKVQKNLFGRFLQHIGIAHKRTTSLRLRKWIKDFENIEIKFRYVQFDEDIIPYLEDFENIYWRKFNPLLGKEPNLK